MNRSKLHTYDDVADRVAERLDVADPSKIRFTRHNYYLKKPESNPIQYRFEGHLPDMLRHYIQVSIYLSLMPLSPREFGLTKHTEESLFFFFYTIWVTGLWYYVL